MTLNWILLIVGLIICFGGIYIRKLCSAILGLIWGALCTFLIILAVVGLWDFDEDYLVAVVVCALVCAVLSAIYEKLCVVINTFLSSFFLVAMLLLAAQELETSVIILLAVVVSLVVSVLCAKIYIYAYVVITAFSGAFIANIGGYGIMHDYEAAEVLIRLLNSGNVSSSVLIGTLILGVLGCLVQWGRIKGKPVTGGKTENADASASFGAMTPSARMQAAQSPLVREIKEHWSLLLAPWLVEIVWDQWGYELLWKLSPSMFDYAFDPETLWQYMPSIISYALAGWVMAALIMVIKRRSKGFFAVWMIPYMILELIHLVEMFKQITDYPGPTWMFSLRQVIYPLLPVLFWWVIRRLEQTSAFFSRQDVRTYVLCGAGACLVTLIIGYIISFILNHSIAYDGSYTPIWASLLRLCAEIAVMAVIIRAYFRRGVPDGASAADPAVNRRDWQ